MFSKNSTIEHSKNFLKVFFSNKKKEAKIWGWMERIFHKTDIKLLLIYIFKLFFRVPMFFAYYYHKVFAVFSTNF